MTGVRTLRRIVALDLRQVRVERLGGRHAPGADGGGELRRAGEDKSHHDRRLHLIRS
jgi:hypothetical protein